MVTLFIINSLNMGGAEALILLQAIELKKRGEVVHVVVLKDGHPDMESRFVENKIDVIRLRGRPFLSIPCFLYVLHKVKPDIVHAHLFPSLLYGGVAKVLHFCNKLFFTEHNTTNNRRKWFLWPFDVAMYIPLDRLVCISYGVQTETTKWNRFLKNKSVVIENAISPCSVKSEYDCIAGNFRLITVGRLVADKNIELQIRMLCSVEYAHLDIYGEGSLRRSLEDLSVLLGVRNRVNFCGVTNSLPKIYRRYDAYIHTATLEGFGLVVAEAMSAGLPVIVPNLPGISEVAGEAGCKYNPNSLDELIVSVGSLANLSKNEREALGARSIKQSMKFGIEQHVDKLLSLYLT